METTMNTTKFMDNNTTTDKNDKSKAFEKIFNAAVKLPLIKVDREKFLRSQLTTYCKGNQLEEAVKYGPLATGLSKKQVSKLADKIIEADARKTALISGVASFGTTGAPIAGVGIDITSMFAMQLRTMQELAYLYGLGDLGLNAEEKHADAQLGLVAMLGAMYCAEGSGILLKNYASALQKQSTKLLGKVAILRSDLFIMTKKTFQTVGVRLTASGFADTVANVVPVLGAFTSGGLMYFSFKKPCKNLQKQLDDLDL